VLYGLVQAHLESLLQHARDEYQHGLPRYVEQALRKYLECGVLARTASRAPVARPVPVRQRQEVQEVLRGQRAIGDDPQAPKNLRAVHHSFRPPSRSRCSAR
jgi:hypothetical protein